MTNSTDPFASVVTARDVYGAVQELRGEMRTTAAEVRVTQRDVSDLRDDVDSHEKRLQSLERWRARWPLASLGALAGGLAALVAAILQFFG